LEIDESFLGWDCWSCRFNVVLWWYCDHCLG